MNWAKRLMPDGLLAAGLFLVTLGPGQVLQGGPGLQALQAALTLPLVWRRRAPFAVFCVIAAAACVQLFAGVRLPADVALLVALYTVGAHSTWRHTLVAGAVLEAGVLLASARWAPAGQFLFSAVALTAMAVAAGVLGTNLRARRAYTGALERDRDQRARLAVAEERARMARDMHDIVAHNLSVMVALADSATYMRPRASEEVSGALERIAGTGREALADLRRSLGVPRQDAPEALRHPAPGIVQLEALADRMSAAGLPTRLEVAGEAGLVPAAAQLTVYRLVQEALTNAMKHAPGTQATVRLTLGAESITLDITDAGPAAGAVDRGGAGILGMRERVAAYGGTLRAGPTAEGGWRVTATLCLEAAAEKPAFATEGAL